MVFQISDRALPSGSGTENIAIANLIAWFRVSSPSLSIFYAHVLLSVIACLGQTPVELDANRNYLWKSFLLGRVDHPSYLFFIKNTNGTLLDTYFVTEISGEDRFGSWF